MAMRLTERELKDLLARGTISVHGEEKLSTRKRSKKKREKGDFQSYAEELYYDRCIRLLELIGEVVECKMHESFEVIPAVSYGSHRLKARHYTPDFILHFKDGRVKVVEVKGKTVRKLQRDYPLRRQLFIIHFCIPNGWEFEEVSAEALTGGQIG